MSNNCLVPSEGGLGLVLTGQGAGKAPIWAAGGGGVSWPLTNTADEAFEPNAVANAALNLHNPASAVNGLQISGSATTVAVPVAAIGSDTNIPLTINAKGSGTIAIGSVSTGAVTITPATTVTGALTLSSTLSVGASTGTAGHFIGSNGASAPTWQGVAFERVFSVPGVLSVQTGNGRVYANQAGSVTEVRASVGTAPTGASLIVDVLKNGTTMYTTQANRPTITAGNFTVVATLPDVTSLASGDYITVNVAQVGSSVPGSDLAVQITVTPT